MAGALICGYAVTIRPTVSMHVGETDCMACDDGIFEEPDGRRSPCVECKGTGRWYVSGAPPKSVSNNEET